MNDELKIKCTEYCKNFLNDEAGQGQACSKEQIYFEAFEAGAEAQKEIMERKIAEVIGELVKISSPYKLFV